MAAESLFNVVFDGYARPAELAIEQTKADLIKTQNAAAQDELQNQKAMQAGLQQIWGPGGEVTAATSILQARGFHASGNLRGSLTDQVQGGMLSSVAPGANAQTAQDPATDGRLQATAALMYRTGNVADANSLLNTLSLNKQRQASAQRAALTSSATGLRMVGGALGAVTDQASYTAVLSDLQEQGTDVSRLGLSGDYQTDAPKLAALANASLTQAQRLTAAQQKVKESDLNQYRGTRLQQIDQSLSEGQQKVDQARQRLDIYGSMAAQRVREDDRKDSRAQQGLELKQAKSTVQVVAQTARVKPVEQAIANEVFGSDEATKAIPEHLRAVYSREAAQKAKQILAAKAKEKGPDFSYSDADYNDALHSAISEMAQQGRFDPSNRSAGLFGLGSTPTYGYQPPKGNVQPSESAPAAAQPRVASPVPDAVASQFKSAADVTAAFAAGKLTREQAKAILQRRFGAR